MKVSVTRGDVCRPTVGLGQDQSVMKYVTDPLVLTVHTILSPITSITLDFSGKFCVHKFAFSRFCLARFMMLRALPLYCRGATTRAGLSLFPHKATQNIITQKQTQ